MPIEARGVSKRFDPAGPDVLQDIRLRIKDGEWVALTGKSGSGKSTLLYILSTLDAPSSGNVLIDGRNVSSLGMVDVHRLRNRQVGFIFQFHYLLPELTAIENVLMPARKAGTLDQARDHGLELLRQFGLEDKIQRFPNQLSGGEQQRVAIARALVMRPKYLFADEPTGNLDSANGQNVMALLARSNREMGMTILLVTHESDYAALAGRTIRLADGRIVDTD